MQVYLIALVQTQCGHIRIMCKETLLTTSRGSFVRNFICQFNFIARRHLHRGLRCQAQALVVRGN